MYSQSDSDLIPKEYSGDNLCYLQHRPTKNLFRGATQGYRYLASRSFFPSHHLGPTSFGEKVPQQALLSTVSQGKWGFGSSAPSWAGVGGSPSCRRAAPEPSGLPCSAPQLPSSHLREIREFSSLSSLSTCLSFSSLCFSSSPFSFSVSLLILSLYYSRC